MESSFDPVAYINTPRWHHSSLGLDRIEELLNRIGRPQDSLHFVHVSGTNGKGSVCSYLSNILQAAGYKTGLFTSPYIEHFEERIRINGVDISFDDLTRVTLTVRVAAEEMKDHPTEFELMCAVALLYFAEQECDIVVLEVGLGGRFDATNVIDRPELCVITRIGLDHTDILGDTLSVIAAEKAGIIKKGCKVVSWPQEVEAMASIQEAAKINNAQLQVVDFSELVVDPLSIDISSGSLPQRHFVYQSESYETSLLAAYQPFNAALAIAAANCLQEQDWSISLSAVKEGIKHTTWAGRFEVIGFHPLFIVDGGHNPQGAIALASTIQELLPHVKPIFLIGVLADKDYISMLETIVSLGSGFVAITPDNPRALPAEKLKEHLEQIIQQGEEGLKNEVPIIRATSIEEGVKEACDLAGDMGCVCAFGSLYSIASIKGAHDNLFREC